MKSKTILATISLVAIVFAWTTYELTHRRPIDYEWHNYLINASTGEKLKPYQLVDAKRVLNITDEYVNSTNSLERLHELEKLISFVTLFESDQVYTDPNDLKLSGAPVANQGLCSLELDWIKQQLASNQNYALVKGQLGLELTQLMDSFGKPSSEVYSGRVAWPGSYERCLRTSLDGGRIKTRYCWARMRPKQWPEKVPVRPQPRIRVGVCLPETCDTLSFDGQRQTIEWLIKLDMNEFYRDTLQLDSMFCLPDERSPIRRITLGGRIYLWLLGGWLATVLIFTIIHEFTRRKQKRIASKSMMDETRQRSMNMLEKNGRKTIHSFQQDNPLDESNNVLQQRWLQVMAKSLSIRNSIKNFRTNTFAVKMQDSISELRVDLSCLNAFKFLMAIMIVLAHSGYLSARLLQAESDRLFRDQNKLILIGLSLGRFVDSFYLLFGLLAAYTLLRKVKVDELVNLTTWFGYNVAVLLRLVPLILPIYYFALLISPYLFAGPWWDYGVFRWSLKGHCINEPWWKVIPYVGNLGGVPLPMCMPQTWFLTVYAQLSLIVPLLIYCLCKLPNQLAKLSLLSFIFIVTAVFLGSRFNQQTTFKEGTIGLYGALILDLTYKFESLGVLDCLGRASCVSIGCYVGYLLRMYEIGTIRKWPKWMRRRRMLDIVFVLHLFAFLMPWIGNEVSRLTQHRTELGEFIGGFIVMNFLWSILNGILAILLVTKYSRIAIVRFFGHSFWCLANKLGYAIFLVHWEVLLALALANGNSPTHEFVLDTFKLFSLGSLISITLAFFLHILVEAPINAILNLIPTNQSGTNKQVDNRAVQEA